MRRAQSDHARRELVPAERLDAGARAVGVGGGLRREHVVQRCAHVLGVGAVGLGEVEDGEGGVPQLCVPCEREERLELEQARARLG